MHWPQLVKALGIILGIRFNKEQYNKAMVIERVLWFQLAHVRLIVTTAICCHHVCELAL
jgi:hypothetical protein